jgi:hypothetical protein
MFSVQNEATNPIRCGNDGGCKVRYDWSSTGFVYGYSPAYVAFGSRQSAIVSGRGNYNNIKRAESSQSLITELSFNGEGVEWNPEVASNNALGWYDVSNIGYTMGNPQSTKDVTPLLRGPTGNYYNIPTSLIYNFAGTESYRVRIAPRVTKVEIYEDADATVEGFQSGGTKLKISADGLTGDWTKTSVMVGDATCTIDAVISSTLTGAVVCSTGASSQLTSDQTFPIAGGLGLKRTVYKPTTEEDDSEWGKFISTASVFDHHTDPSTTGTLARTKDIMAGTEVLNQGLNHYGQVLEGYFLAPATGDYLFYPSMSAYGNLYFLADATKKVADLTSAVTLVNPGNGKYNYGYRGFTRFQQKTEAFALTAGEAYPIRVICGDKHYGRYCSVGVEFVRASSEPAHP